MWSSCGVVRRCCMEYGILGASFLRSHPFPQCSVAVQPARETESTRSESQDMYLYPVLHRICGVGPDPDLAPHLGVGSGELESTSHTSLTVFDRNHSRRQKFLESTPRTIRLRPRHHGTDMSTEAAAAPVPADKPTKPLGMRKNGAAHARQPADWPN